MRACEKRKGGVTWLFAPGALRLPEPRDPAALPCASWHPMGAPQHLAVGDGSACGSSAHHLFRPQGWPKRGKWQGGFEPSRQNRFKISTGKTIIIGGTRPGLMGQSLDLTQSRGGRSGLDPKSEKEVCTVVACRVARAVSPLSRGLSSRLRLKQRYTKPNRHRHGTGREGAKTRAVVAGSSQGKTMACPHGCARVDPPGNTGAVALGSVPRAQG